MLIECRGERELESVTAHISCEKYQEERTADCLVIVITLINFYYLSIFVVTFLLHYRSCYICKFYCNCERTWYIFILQFWLRARDRHLISSSKKKNSGRKNREARPCAQASNDIYITIADHVTVFCLLPFWRVRLPVYLWMSRTNTSYIRDLESQVNSSCAISTRYNRKYQSRTRSRKKRSANKLICICNFL